MVEEINNPTIEEPVTVEEIQKLHITSPTLPKVASGIWSIFNGSCKDEVSSKTTDQIQLITQEDVNKIKTFAELPMSLNFREKISASEIKLKVNEWTMQLASSPSCKILTGVVKVEGPSIKLFKDSFDLGDEFFMTDKYSKNTRLTIIPYEFFMKHYSILLKTQTALL